MTEPRGDAVTAENGPWGPHAAAGRTRGPSRLVVVVVVVVAALVAAAVTAGALLYLRAGDALTQVPVEGLTEADGDEGTGAETRRSSARHFLVVGSDSREATTVHAEDVALGDKEGQRSDVLMYVSLTEDRDAMSIVSIPRDLIVEHEGRTQRISRTFEEGADALVAAVQEQLGLPVHHFAQVSFDGFIDAVDTIGGVDICLEEDLVDPDAGADLRAGCQRLEPAEALGFVRSRQGERGDYERIDRQQRFLRAAAEELTRRRVLANVPQLFDLVEDVAGNVTTDDALSLPELLGLADEVRDLIDDDVPMVSVPSYPATLGEALVMRVYEPGARALFREVRQGRLPADRGTREEREETSVAILTSGRVDATEIIGSVLHFGGIGTHRVLGPGPASLDAGATTTVYAAGTDDAPARRVAALLGAPLRSMPADVELPGDHDVVVAVGRDAAGTEQVTGFDAEPSDRLETRGPAAPSGEPSAPAPSDPAPSDAGP